MKRKYLSILIILISNNLLAQTSITKLNLQTKKIAGIEVGSKGVKLSILEQSLENKESIKLLKDSSVNTDFISFSPTSYDATLNALSGLYNYVLNTWKIPATDIATVISSGVKAQSDKLNKQNHLRTFIDAFKIKINDDNKAIEVIDVIKESYLSHYGIVAKENRYNTFLIDIGSGNTKGGYFKANSSDFVMFQIPSGTKSTNNLIEKKCATPCDFNNFKTNTTVIVDSLEKSEIIYAVNASGAYPSSSTIAISGGIAWAVATLLFPEKADATIDLSYKDVVRFRDNLIKYNADIPDTSKIVIKGMSTEELSKIRKTVQKVISVFDTKSLLAGTTLMLKIMRQFESTNASKKFRLIKNGQVGWITGYILNKGEMKLQ